MRDGAVPDSFEGADAELDHGRVIGQFVLQKFTVSGEVTEPDEPFVEDPEVVARQAQVGRLPARQPPHLLAGCDVDRIRQLVLEPDEVAKRFGHDAGTPETDSAGDMGAHEIRPGRVPRVGEGITSEPTDEPLVIWRVGVTHLQMHG
jgi:hypothetical protein